MPVEAAQNPSTEVGPEASMQPAMTDPSVIERPVGRGSVNVVTRNGWASVHWRGRRLAGETPAVVVLPAGNQVIELRPNGSAPGVRRRVRVRANQTHRLVVGLP